VKNEEAYEESTESPTTGTVLNNLGLVKKKNNKGKYNTATGHCHCINGLFLSWIGSWMVITWNSFFKCYSTRTGKLAKLDQLF